MSKIILGEILELLFLAIEQDIVKRKPNATFHRNFSAQSFVQKVTQRYVLLKKKYEWIVFD